MKYEITAPNGQKFEVTAPDGATQDEVLAYAQKNWEQPKAPAQDNTPSIAQGAVQSFGRGASFGLSDRLGALASSLLGGAQSAGEYGDFGETYTENLKGIQKDRDAFSAAHPVIDTAANVAGSLASGIPAAKALSAVKPVSAAFQAMRPWQQYVTSGALAGGLAGAGNAAPDEMAEGAVTGAGTGALLGATVPAAVKLGLKAGDALIGTPVRAAVNALRTPESQGVRLLAKSLARDEVPSSQLAQTLQEMGPNATIADAAGRNTLALADYAAQTPGVAKNAGINTLETRAKTAGGRVMESLGNMFGVKSTNFHGITQQLNENMRQVAKTHNVDKILDTGAADATGQLEELLKTPTIKSALQGAYNKIADQAPGNPAARKTLEYFDVGPNGEVSGVKSFPSLRALDYVKRQLDAIINDGTDGITGKLTSKAVDALDLKRRLLGTIDNLNPDYAKYRAAYADEKARQGALKLGRAFMHDDAEVTLERLADMSPAEKQFFQAGAARAIRDKIMSGSDTGMSYAQFVKRPAVQEKLQAVFGDNPNFPQFMKSLENEVKMGQTHSRLVGNSKTAERAMVAQDVGSPIAGQIPTSKEQLVRAGLNYLTRPNDEVSAQLFNVLLSQDPAKQAAVIKALQGLDAKMSRNLLDPAQASRLGLGANALLSSQVAR